MGNFIKNTTTVVMALLFLSSCTQKEEVSSKVALHEHIANQHLKVNIVNEPRSLDPRYVRTLSDMNIAKMFLEGLTRLDKDDEASLALASSYKISEDEKTYTFTLRDAFWSNGDPIVADDFVNTWKKTLSKDFLASNAYLMYIIHNAKEVKNGTLPASLLGVKAVDSKTLSITLSHPVPFFTKLLAHPIFFPVHTKTVEKHSNWSQSKETYVTSGPFKINEWEHHDVLIAVKSPTYWDSENVKLQTIEMVMVPEETGLYLFQNRELLLGGSPFGTIPFDAVPHLTEENKLMKQDALATIWLRTNVSRTPLSHQGVRQALSLAINREEIAQNITCNTHSPALHIVPKSMNLQTKSCLSDGDSEKACIVLKKAMEDGNITIKDLNKISLAYTVSDRSHSIAQAIQQQWFDSLGFLVKLKPMEKTMFFDAMSQSNYDIAFSSWYADVGDAVNFLEVFKTAETATNNTNWEDSQYAECISQSYKEAVHEKRDRLLKKAEHIILNAVPAIPLLTTSYLYVKDDCVKNVHMTKSGFLDFKEVYLDAM